jgi:hypothetical protein
VRAESGPRFLHLKLSFKFREIDESRRRLLIDVRLPFGVSVLEDMTCVPLDKGQCRVNYACNFGFPSGIRGRLMRLVLGREMQAGPADSFSRTYEWCSLKRQDH